MLDLFNILFIGSIMNIRDLKYLVAIADHGHFGKAAIACFVSQPALSMQIKKLEDDLGVKLIERNSKKVLLTDTGLLIAEQARRILDQVQEVRETAMAAKNVFSGELRIGIFPTLSPYLLPLIVPKLSKRFHKLSFHLVEAQTSALLENLQEGKIHAAFLAAPITEPALKHNELFEEDFLLAIPVKHPLNSKKTIKQGDLSGEKLLLLEEGHCLREQALSLCQAMQTAERHNFRATSLETLRHMITAGVGITLMPQLACDFESETISYLPFQNPKPSRKISLCWRANSAKDVVLREIANQIKTILSLDSKVRVLA
jgi:LysR family hydrogen peroxide-inducible transcriptional activator